MQAWSAYPKLKGKEGGSHEPDYHLTGSYCLNRPWQDQNFCVPKKSGDLIVQSTFAGRNRFDLFSVLKYVAAQHGCPRAQASDLEKHAIWILSARLGLSHKKISESCLIFAVEATMLCKKTWGCLFKKGDISIIFSKPRFSWIEKIGVSRLKRTGHHSQHCS